MSCFLCQCEWVFLKKKNSIKQLIQEHSPDIVLLTETKVYTKVSIKIDGYQVFPAVRKRGSGGGLAVAVKHGLCSSLVIDYGENAEFITVRLCFGLESIRLILAYGPQEGDAKDEIEDSYENFQIQIDRSVLKGDSVLIVGDLNAKLGKTVIKNHDIHDMSANGKLLYDIINKYNLCVVNALRLCKGVFTRVNNKNSAEKSVLDYVIVSSNLSDNIQSLTIDEGKLSAPWRNLQRGKRLTDHNAIIFELQCERSKGNDKSNRKVVWNFNDDKGWEKFRDLMGNDSSLLEIWKSGSNVQICYQNWQSRLDRILGMCFKKKRISERKQLYNSEIRSLISKRKKLKTCDSFGKNYGKQLRKLNAKIDRKIARYNSDAVKKSIGKNGVIGKGDFWKLKKRLLPKAHNVPHALQDQSGFEITDPINIKSEYKAEF